MRGMPEKITKFAEGPRLDVVRECAVRCPRRPVAGPGAPARCRLAGPTKTTGPLTEIVVDGDSFTKGKPQQGSHQRQPQNDAGSPGYPRCQGTSRDVARFTPGVQHRQFGLRTTSRFAASPPPARRRYPPAFISMTRRFKLRALAFQPGRGTAEILRYRPHRGAGRGPQGYSVRLGVRGRHRTLHHHSAQA